MAKDNAFAVELVVCRCLLSVPAPSVPLAQTLMGQYVVQKCIV
ncbi:hypothetical protein ALO42_102666 [Pseudomonas syringae pv. atrofaciens]|uniref:Uncharacterized protein n=3 Tax=Pseudomonas syringae group TaxID=136849 RepID=A0A3M5WZM3_9PSED|nr:hypothetical protein ALO42_102666 [Pseudomonas syringae pv. atrofaciens]KPX65606.1 hypothetical protein ALO39_102091 [Pseudomonas syringae pv. lapsa]KPY72352.1 hypothetical protein ALO45_102094 [Pseudomonas syringae pv. syringae]KPY99745.1 hypothetical protein ALO85_101890 [Pseudomonas syringae pv. aptata]RMN70512.1 hypothetical protein ALQ54_101744 [Pseudomonas syringae]RMU75872.1 hypothetical protein ALP23_102282 [Pseudomonas syringae pv. apii]